MPRDDGNRNGLAQAEAGPSRKRIAKACSNCQVRRTKCDGTIPCKACRDNGLEGSCFVRDKARPNRLAYSARRARPTVEDAELLIRPIEDRASISSRNSPVRPLSRQPRWNPIADIELRAQKWCVENGLTPGSLLFHDQDRMATLSSTPLPTSPSELIALEDALMRHLIMSRDNENQGRIGRSQFVRLYNRYRSDPASLSDDQRSVVYAVLCLAKHDTLQSVYASGQQVGEGHTREDVTYFRMACACLANVRVPSIHAVLSLLCLVPFAQAHGGMSESRSLLRMMAWHVRETGLHRQEVVDSMEPGEVDPAIFPMFRYMDTMMAGLDDLEPFFANSESDVPLDIPPHVSLPVQQTAAMFSGVFHDDLADPTLDIRSDGYINVAESSWAPALDEVRREKMLGRGPRFRLIWAEMRYHWLRVLLYTTRCIPPADPARAAQASIVVAHSTVTIVYIHHELINIGYLFPSWPQLRRLAVISQLLVLLTDRGEIPAAQADELFSKVIQVLDAHRSGWATAAGRLVEGIKRAGVALGLSLSTASPAHIPPHIGAPSASASGSISHNGLNTGGTQGSGGGAGADSLPMSMMPPGMGDLSFADTLPDGSAGIMPGMLHQQQPSGTQTQGNGVQQDVFGMWPFDPMSLFLDETVWNQEATAGTEPGLDDAALNELLGIPMQP